MSEIIKDIKTKFYIIDEKGAENSLRIFCEHYHNRNWMSADNVLIQTNITDMLQACRWKYNKDSQTIHFLGQNLGDDLQIFSAIARFVADGSFIDIEDENHISWRWEFQDGEALCSGITSNITATQQ